MRDEKRSAQAGGRAQEEAAGATSTGKYSIVGQDCQATVLEPLVACCGRNLCDRRYRVILERLLDLTRRWAR